MNDTLVRIDAALLRLRRFLDVPAGSRAEAGAIPHAEGRVEVSTLLVVDAIARRTGRGEGECIVGCVADFLQVAHSTASRLVDRAVTAGMVHSGRSAADPRRLALTLSPAGRDLQQQAVRFRTGRLHALLSGWHEDEVATFARLLERFAADAQRPSTKETS